MEDIMVNPTDPNKIVLTGENSYIRLHAGPGGALLTRLSHWRILMSPAGPGHVLYLKSDLTNDEVRIYSDNIALARWLQGEIETFLFPDFADENIPVTEAEFSKTGDVRSFWTESVHSEEESITLNWYDFKEPYMLTAKAGTVEGRPHGVYSCFIPARRAQLTLNGIVAEGETVPEMRGDKQSSTSCLAWSETWVKP